MEYKERQERTVQWIIKLPMDFPTDWNSDEINFYLNDSSWCCDNLIDELKKYSEKYGCICNICEAEVER